jgi:hypothetical protein
MLTFPMSSAITGAELRFSELMRVSLPRS